jgi:cytidylate kinase
LATAADSIQFDTSDLTIDQVVDDLHRMVIEKERINGRG